MCSFFVTLCLLSAKSRVAAKAKAILLKHFNEAISDKEGEIEKINEAIVEAQTSLHLLRYGCVSKTYAAFKASASSSVRTILFYKMHAPIEIEDLIFGMATSSTANAGIWPIPA